ncbi:adenosylcobinamide-GDP ribazoletransferase [Hahella ganghwensis]|uniref:adenosylcobinamide-GDP ribazoletransferase n=1 Tax=Hahella ganghwensis TaxID=286420 RepID=UPI00035D419A|nr:adenosylcobinamide-GDP ribazoletransferase [Hahella ganghwensis]
MTDLADKAPRWQQELQWFLMALQFYTRIPVQLPLPFKDEDLNHASRYIGAVGWIVAALCTLGYCLGLWLYGPWAAALLAVVAGVLVTGAFHEDGLADALDGFGGGYTPEHILDIMKDSRVGTYGALALVFTVASKIIMLAHFEWIYALLGLWVAHSSSRVLAISLVGDLPYVQADMRSKVKPIAKSIDSQDVMIAMIFGIIPLLFLPLLSAVMVVIALLCLRYGARRYLSARLGGYTGDCLGAVQQLGEMLVLFVLAAVF